MKARKVPKVSRSLDALKQVQRVKSTTTLRDSYCVREVHRKIHQNVDGSVQTVEHETSKERMFMQQEEMVRELENAKELYGARQRNMSTRLLDEWSVLG